MHVRGWIFGAAVAFYLGLALFFFREAIFTDRVQLCNDITMSTYPWALKRPADFTPSNVALSDQMTVFYPWFHYTAKMLQQGELPLWTPHALGGAPYMGNLSTAIFYPLNLLIALLPLSGFFLIQCLIKVVAAGLFTYLFLRALGMRYSCALFGGTVYALSGFTILWVISHLTSVSILMPALFWSTELYLKKRNGPGLALIALLLGLQFLGAQPETSLCVVTAWGIYTLFRIRKSSGWFNTDGAAHLGYLAAAGLLAGGLVLFQLWPFYEYMNRSYGLFIRELGARVHSLYGGVDPLFSVQGLGVGLLCLLALSVAAWLLRRGKQAIEALGAGLLIGAAVLVFLKSGFFVGLKPHILIQLFPDLYGNSMEGMRTTGGTAYPEFNGGYVGGLAFFLALYAALSRKPRHPTGVLFCLFLLSFGAVHGLPFLFQFVNALPFFDLTQPGRIVVVATFCLSVLSALGLEKILAGPAGGDPAEGNFAQTFCRSAGAAVVIGAAVLLNGWALLDGNGSGDSDAQGSPGVAEKSRPEPGRVEIFRPVPGEVFSGEKGLFINGAAGPGVERVSFFLNGIGVGAWFADAGESSTPGVFDFKMSLDRFKEGRYRLGIKIDPPPKNQEAFWVMYVQVRHFKKITTKDLLIFLASLGCMGLLLVNRSGQGIRLVLAFGLIVVDLSLFGASYNTTSQPHLLYPDNEVTDYLSSRRGIFRILPENVILQPSTNYIYEYQIIRGYDGLELPEYNALIALMKLDPWVDIHHYNSKTLNYESPVIDLLGIRYIISEDDLSGIPGLTKVLDGPVKIFENAEALPRAFVVGQWIQSAKILEHLQGDLSEALETLRPALAVQEIDFDAVASSRDDLISYAAGNFDFKNWALVEDEIDLTGGGSGEVTHMTHSNDVIEMDVRMQGEGLLILTENFYPGWRAEVDGQEVDIFRANVTFKAIPMKDGAHKVKLTYYPNSFYHGIYVAIVCGIVLLVLAFLRRLPGLRQAADPKRADLDNPPGPV